MASSRMPSSDKASSTDSGVSKHTSMDLSGSVFLISGDGKTLKLPIPTKTSRDPLNWSSQKRIWALVSLMIFSVAGLVAVESPSLMFPLLLEEFSQNNTRPFGVDVLLSAPTIFMGIGSFTWIPLSLAIGRRSVFILNTIILSGSVFWASVASSFPQLLVAVSLQGLAEGFAASAVLLMIIDITFIHERPNALAAIWAVGGCIPLIFLSLLLPFITSVAGYRTWYAIWAIPCAITVPFAFFFYPETYFIRPAVAFDGRVLMQSATEKTIIYPTWDESPQEKALPELPTPPTRRLLSKLSLFSRTEGGWKAMAHCYLQISFCVINPLIFWIVILNAIAFGGMLSIGMTFAQLLTSPPYNLPIQTAALPNLAAATGSLLSWPIIVITAGRLSRHLTIRAGGVRHAEHYLPTFILPILAGAASNILYGYAAENKWPAVWIFVAYGLNGFSYAGLSAANTLWVTEAFPRWAAPALVLVGGGSYIESFALSFSIPLWLKAQGFAVMNLKIGIAFLVTGMVVVPIKFWGKRLRQRIHGRWAESERGALRPQ